jgi:hypothetical protein
MAMKILLFDLRAEDIYHCFGLPFLSAIDRL